MYQVGIIQILLVAGLKYCHTEQEPFRKCHAFSGDDANTNLEQALHIYKTCFMQNLANFRHTVPSNTCQDTTLKIKACDVDVVRKIEACRSYDGHYFPKIVFTTISDYTRHICEHSRSYKCKFNFEVPILLDHQICFPSLEDGIDCFDRFRFFNSSVNISEEDMCSDENDVMECLLGYANSTCQTDEVFPQLVVERFNSSHPPCAASRSSVTLRVSSVLLFILHLLTLI